MNNSNAIERTNSSTSQGLGNNQQSAGTSNYGNRRPFSGYAKNAASEESKKEIAKDDMILFDDGEKAAETKPPQRSFYNEKESSYPDPYYKKLKKERDEYTRFEMRSNDFRRNKEGSFDNSYQQQQQKEEVRTVPWMSKRTAGISSSLVRAHNEIIEFVNYIIPSKEDHRLREKSMER